MTNLWLFPRRQVNFNRSPGDICQPLHLDQRRALPTSRTRTTWWHEEGSVKLAILLDNTVRGQPVSTSGKTSRISRTTACHWLREETWFSRKKMWSWEFRHESNLLTQSVHLNKWTWQHRQFGLMIWLPSMLRVPSESLDFKATTIS